MVDLMEVEMFFLPSSLSTSVLNLIKQGSRVILREIQLQKVQNMRQGNIQLHLFLHTSSYK